MLKNSHFIVMKKKTKFIIAMQFHWIWHSHLKCQSWHKSVHKTLINSFSFKWRTFYLVSITKQLPKNLMVVKLYAFLYNYFHEHIFSSNCSTLHIKQFQIILLWCFFYGCIIYNIKHFTYSVLFLQTWFHSCHNTHSIFELLWSQNNY